MRHRKYSFTIPSGTIPGYGFFLCEQTEAATAVTADYLYGTEAYDFQNGGDECDGIRIKDDTDTVIDTLLYGGPENLSNLEDDSGEPSTSFAPDVASDHSLERRAGYTDESGGNGVDTDQSGNDFLDRATPDPQNTASATELPTEGPPPAQHVVINEVLYNPSSGEPAGEYIELYNPNTTTSFAIDGWSVSDQEGTHQIPNPTTGDDYVIGPEEYVTLAYSGCGFFMDYHYYPDFEFIGATPAVELEDTGSLVMSNAGDEVILTDKNGNLIDVVVWDAGAYGTIAPYPANEWNGESIQRMPAGYESPETADGASPTGHDESTEDMSSAVFIRLKSPSPVTRDLNPPIISAVTVDARSTIALVNWTTTDTGYPEANDRATSEVVYAASADPDSTANISVTDAGYVTAHSVLLTGLTPSTTYYFYVKSTDGLGHTVADKNGGAYYTFTTDAYSPFNYYHGNLHCHTGYSDGAAGSTPEDAYLYARDTAKIDFLAVTDHSYDLSVVEYDNTLSYAATYTADGSFVALAGQEWGIIGDHGHLNAFEASEICNVPSNDLAGFYDWANTEGVPSGFNHPSLTNGGTSFDNFAYTTAGDNAVDIIAVLNGAYSRDTETYYFETLWLGWHLGPVGDQDNHDADWGNKFQTGTDKVPLTGIVAPSLTKANVLEAIREHRIYTLQATYVDVDTPPVDKLNLTFSANGHMMGESFSDSKPLVFNITASSPSSPIDDMWLYVDGTLVETNYNVKQNSYSWRPTIELTNGEHFIFVKVDRDDDHTAWSLPIWVTKPAMVLPDSLPVISDVEHTPNTPSSADNVKVTATVTDDNSIYNAKLWYSVDGAAYTALTMYDDGLTYSDELPNDKLYTAEIPAQADGSAVSYYIEAIDDRGGSILKPSTAPTYFYSYVVGLYVVISEIFANPLYEEIGAEFIELYNPTASAIDISDWTLQDEYGGSYSDLWAFPDGASIAAGGYIVIAKDCGYNAGDADTFWGKFGTASSFEFYYPSTYDTDFSDAPNMVAVDANSELSLEYYYDALYLQNADGISIDAVEYGREGISVPGTYTEDAPEDQAMSRDEFGTDTDDCAVDFCVRPPTPFAGDNVPPKIWSVGHSTPTDTAAVTVTARIEDEYSGMSTALYYSVNGGAYTSTAIVDDGSVTGDVAGDGIYTGQIPAQPNGTIVTYYITATDTEPQTASSPADAPTLNYSYIVGPHVVINEIHVNPPEVNGSYYDGSEFIELYNPTDAAVDISGWRLQDEPWEYFDAWEFPGGTSVPSKGFIVIAKDGSDPPEEKAAKNDGFYQEFGFLPTFEMHDADTSAFGTNYDFDNTSVANLTQVIYSDWDNQIRFDNDEDGDALYLINPNNLTIDAVEYLVEATHIAGTYADAPPEGYALTRDVYGTDTDDSRADFFQAPPTPNANASKSFLYFDSGWNLMSIPMTGSAYDTAEALGSALPGCKWVAQWNTTAEAFDSYEVGSETGDFDVEPGEGYLVHVSAYTGLQIYGSVLMRKDVALVEGWNSVGPLKATTTASALCSSIGSNCGGVAKWERATGRFSVHVKDRDISDFTIARNDACLVYMSAADTWTNE